jgi:hypothetical protein
VNFLPTRRISIRPYSKINSESFNMGGEEWELHDLSLGKEMLLKSPPIHYDKFYQLSNLASSSQSNILS